MGSVPSVTVWRQKPNPAADPLFATVHALKECATLWLVNNFRPLWRCLMAAVLVCALFACGDPIKDVFQQRAEDERLANLALNSLVFPKAAQVDPQSLKMTDGAGPQIVGFTALLVVEDQREFTLTLYVGQRADRAKQMVIRLLNASKWLTVPITVDARAKTVSVSGTIDAHNDILNQRWRGQIALADDTGVMGRPMPFGIEPRAAGSESKMAITRLFGNTWETELVAYSKSGALLANAGRDLLNPAEPSWPAVRLWNTETHQPVLSAKPTTVVTAITFSPDEQWLAAGHTDGSIQLWSTADGTKGPSFQTGTDRSATAPTEASATIKKLLFLPQENGLLSTGWNHRISAWNIDTKQQMWSQKLPERVNHMALSPSGELIAAATGRLTHEGQVVVRHTADWSEHAPLPAITFPREATAVAFSHDGKWLAAGAGLGWTGVWSVETGEPLMLSKDTSNTPLFAHPEADDTVSGLTFAPSNSNHGEIRGVGVAALSGD